MVNTVSGEIMHKFRIVELGVVGSFISAIFGGWSEAMTTLLIFMAIDYITGMLVAVCGKSEKSKNGKPNSKVGFKGLCKKGMMMLIIIVAVRLDLLVGTTPYVRDATCIAFIVNETISIIENAGKFIKIPKIIQEVIDFLKSKSNDSFEDEVKSRKKKTEKSDKSEKSNKDDSSNDK